MLARLDSDLRTSPFARRLGTDPRLVDPRLEAEFVATADLVRAEARKQGHAEGLAAGLREGRAQAAQELAEALAAQTQEVEELSRTVRSAVEALSAGAAGLERRMLPSATDAEQQVACIALELVQTLLGHELAVSTDPGAAAVARALALAPVGRPVLARLHPDDLATIATTTCTAPTRVGGPHMPLDGMGGPLMLMVGEREVTLIADATVERGGCLADCDATRIDAQLGAALERVKAALL
jgi:flagellar assembly protein FliH